MTKYYRGWVENNCVVVDKHKSFNHVKRECAGFYYDGKTEYGVLSIGHQTVDGLDFEFFKVVTKDGTIGEFYIEELES